MKFQNSSIHGFKVMLCIKKRDERTDGRTNNPEAICPSNFFEVGGINRCQYLTLYSTQWVKFNRQQIDIFLTFPRKQDQAFHGNCHAKKKKKKKHDFRTFFLTGASWVYTCIHHTSPHCVQACKQYDQSLCHSQTE